MRKFILAFLTGGLLTACDSPEGLTDWVNPLMGTESTPEFSHGNVYPATGVPFGMTQWTAQTGEWGWIYQYQKSEFQGIRATHQPSPWIGDYGQLSFMPAVGEVKFDDKERALPFQHSNEISKPHRYQLTLDNGVSMDLSALSRSGILRFEFPGELSQVIFDASNAPGKLVYDDTQNILEGYTTVNSGGVPENFALYFSIEFDQKVEVEFLGDGGFNDGFYAGPNLGALLATEGPSLELRVGTSFISIEQAAKNRSQELGKKDFEQIVDESRFSWETELSKIRIETPNEDYKKTFYSSMYRTLIFPRVFHEFDGDKMIHYSPYDGKIHDGPMYVDNGFWDTFRGQFPLLSIVQTERHAEMLEGFVNSYKEGDWLPKWTSPGYRASMIGTHSASLLADAYLKGIDNFDYEAGYEAMVKDGMENSPYGGVGREGNEQYIKIGYVPSDQVHEATSRTLEFAYDDFCVAQMAAAMGKEEEAAYFYNRAFNYKNVFNDSSGFMRGRHYDGSWEPGFSPIRWGGSFTEGSAWHYSWSVLHDPAGLIDLMGGTDAFAAKMDAVFESEPTFDVGGYGREIHEMTEMVAGEMGQYAHGNQPVHHFVYLYNYVNQSWKAQKHIRNILTQLYKPIPAGYCGDEDNGQMSAWYVLSSLGFYQVTPGTDQYIVGAPLFSNAIIDLGNGKKLEIKANDAENKPFVKTLLLNGQELNRRWVTYSEIMKGGTIEFIMSVDPIEDLDFELPYSMSEVFTPDSSLQYVPNVRQTANPPEFSTRVSHFSEPFELDLTSSTPNAEIRFTGSGRTPDEESRVYEGPISIERTREIKARSYAEDHYKSPVVAQRYIYVPPHLSVRLKDAPSERYSGGSPLALVDQQMGPRNFFDVAWMGFNGTDVDATIDLGEVKEITEVSANFLEQQSAWILFPDEVRVWTSEDGVNYSEVGSFDHEINVSEGLIIQPMGVEFEARNARYVRVVAKNIGILPNWHPAAGGNAYMFIDEITVR